MIAKRTAATLMIFVLMLAAMFVSFDYAYAEPSPSPNTKALATADSSGTCSDIMDDSVLVGNEREQKKTISQTGLVRWLCSQEPAGSTRNAIEVLIEMAANWLLGIASILFMVMIGVGMVQVMTGGASPEMVKAGKKRIIQAASSIALFALARVVMDLLAITGGNFLGVPVGNFNLDTIYQIIEAVWKYLIFVGGVLAITMIIVGGMKMMTSAGNPQQVQAARKTITYAIIGLLGLLSVGLIFNLIKSALGAMN